MVRGISQQIRRTDTFTHIARRADTFTHISILWQTLVTAFAITHVAVVWHCTIAALAITDTWPSDLFHLAVYFAKCQVNTFTKSSTITCTLTGVTINWNICLRC